MMSVENEFLPLATTVRHAPSTAMLPPCVRARMSRGRALKESRVRDAFETIPVSVMIPVNIYIQKHRSNGVVLRTSKDARYLLSSRLYGRLWNFTKSCPFPDSRALPPIGTFTQPRR